MHYSVINCKKSQIACRIDSWCPLRVDRPDNGVCKKKEVKSNRERRRARLQPAGSLYHAVCKMNLVFEFGECAAAGSCGAREIYLPGLDTSMHCQSSALSLTDNNCELDICSRWRLVKLVSIFQRYLHQVMSGIPLLNLKFSSCSFNFLVMLLG
jgi:hypothetical protein